MEKTLVLDIAAAKEALRFTGNNQYLFDAIHSQYKDFVFEKLKLLKNQVFTLRPLLYGQINQRWKELCALTELPECLLYPEVLNRLLHGNEPPETAAFILLTLDAEIAKHTMIFDRTTHDYLWTSNGDFLLQYNMSTESFDEFKSFSLNDKLPLDFFSPYCIKVSGQDIQESPETVIDEYDYNEAYGIYEKIFECLETLKEERGSGDITRLMYTFTKVIVFKRQNHGLQQRHFFSSTDAYFVGRTVLGNAELVNSEILIDSLIHEAIHSLLYMIDAKYPWQPTPAESDQMGNVILSPWSGNMLSVRNYLQAIFVWYGLFNLWKFAVEKNVYQQEFAVARIAMIRKGFKQVDLSRISFDLNFSFNRTLVATVNEIRRDVLNS